MILKMPTYRLKSAYLQQGWTQEAVVTVSEHGFITAIEQAAPPGVASGTAEPEIIDGIVVPGMPNAHSHAFQRALAGVAEYRSSARDSFWTWREAMYALANRVDPQQLTIIATQLFIEMLKAGYTSVAEFHYLHRAIDGTPYASNDMWQAVDAAAETAGIGLTLLPTLYQSSDFGARPLRAEQARFAMELESFLRGIESQRGLLQNRASSRHRVGAAFHSLRAVPLEVLTAATQALQVIDADMPIHIHIAEQVMEVRSCLEATGRRPIEHLLDQNVITPRWCLVHATHATPAELKAVAQSGAAICVSITTEANLGDGFFDTGRFLAAKGRLCVGSDSQATVSPTEELRWLEYQQRLKKKSRSVLAMKSEPHVGTRLWSEAVRSGAQALGHSAASIAVGARADWLVLDADHPALAGASDDSALDHLIFAGADAAIRDVMVAGRWVIKDGHHAAEQASRSSYAALLRRFT
jgi:formimidoylglutamate deiminase